MKKLNYAAIMIELICFFVVIQTHAYAEFTYPDGMVAYWKLDEGTTTTFADASPSGDNAAQCAVGCPGNNQGVIGNGKAFDGSNDGLVVSAGSDFDWGPTDSFSIELWVKHSNSGLTGEEVLIGRVDEVTSMQWQIKILASGRVAFTLSDAVSGDVTINNSTGKVLTQTIVGESDPRWHHVAVVRDGGANRNFLYVDGVEEASRSITYTQGFASATESVTIGWQDAASQARFDGSLDEVAIYASALDEEEIRGHYFLARAYGDLYESKVRVMPLGDSITEDDYIGAPSGNGWRIAYRLDLWQSLAGGFFWADFIGSQRRGTDYPDFDAECAGFAGIRDNQMVTLLATGYNPRDDEWVVGSAGNPVRYLEIYPADVLLLHIGTNDINSDSSDVADILNEIDAFSQNITVVLARIINRAPDGSHTTTTDFNANINDLAQDRVSRGDKILVVDMENGAGINYSTDMRYSTIPSDVLHPNPAGYTKMAAVWFSELESFLPQSLAPVIVSDAPTTVDIGQTYSYDVNDSGRPSATYVLGQHPAGMSINTDTGVIVWTPSEKGNFDVVVTATNWVDSDTQSFTVSVNSAPQATADSYGPISKGGALNISATTGVLANDSDPDDDPLTAVLVDGPSHGQLTLYADGSFTYQHDGSESSTDSFTYRAADASLQSTVVSVSFSISLTNDVPRITDQKSIVIYQKESVTITLEDLIVEDDDNAYPEGFTLSVRDGSNYSHDGASISPDMGFSGALSVPVVVSDGQASSPEFQVTITVLPVDSPDPGNGDSGGGGCFIQVTGGDDPRPACIWSSLLGFFLALCRLVASFRASN